MRFWMSWVDQGVTVPRRPTGGDVVAHWISGYQGNSAIHCAVIDAPSLDDAQGVVARYWSPREWRFCDEKPVDWMPAADRFPPPMTDQRIPPRPWRVIEGSYYENDERKSMAVIVDANDQEFDLEDRAGELICRLVNAEPEVVAALEAAYQTLLVGHKSAEDTRRSFGMVRAALAKVRP